MNRFSMPPALILSLAALGCSKAPVPERQATDMIVQYGCQTCHVIPGVPGAVGKVGPSLDTLNQRSYLAGTMSNTPETLQRWIMHPQSIHPGTAMPEMGVTQDDAKVIAAYLDNNK
jgi:cytochrome c